MGNSKKQYLTGTVHRLHEGVLESHYAGEEAPEWVTNSKVLTDQAPGSAAIDETQDQNPPPAGSTGQETDDLADLDGKALKKIAGELGLKQSGSKAALAASIRAKRAESAPASAEDAERAALIASLREQGVEVDDDITEAELAALTEQE